MVINYPAGAGSVAGDEMPLEFRFRDIGESFPLSTSLFADIEVV
jgi:hypothetical protein